MLRFEGDRDLPHPPGELWPRLCDVRFLAHCVPGAESVSFPEAETARLTIRPGLSFARGTLDLRMRVTDRREGSAARLLLQTKGIGTSSTVDATFELAPQGDGGTRLHWTAEVTELGGLLKAVPQGLLKAAALKVIADAWEALEARLREA